jgi:hypothetical protein
MPIPLEPFTDYLLDIEMLDRPSADGSPGVSVLRLNFSTGAFGTLQDFARAFQIAKVEHRSAAVNTLQAIGVQFASQAPQGAELDTALMAAGLEPLPVPKYPRVVVFWEQASPAATPQPAAVMIDASEPMWRTRPLPRELSDPDPSGAKRYELVPKQWLALAEQAGGDQIVEHIVPAPGNQRALVTLKSNSRGKHLMLALQKIAQPEKFLDGPGSTDQFFSVADLTLPRAPWEEED